MPALEIVDDWTYACGGPPASLYYPIDASGSGFNLLAEAVAVHDGDTLRVKPATLTEPSVEPWLEVLSTIAVRVRHIDCPELRDPRPEVVEIARKAALFVAEFIGNVGPRLKLCQVRKDKYFRLLADVQVGKVDLAEELTQRGFSRRYDGVGPKPW